ncbi:MAG: hypothetical protein OET44_03610 [Gammaproteobacteria bacterium]|nr:hypothetical protein [Gammaproteobacteria bacterium]
MAAVPQEKLVRKQYLVSERQVEKLKLIASREDKSAAEIVRLAIDAYDPDAVDEMDAPEFVTLVAERLKEAVKSTRAARRKMERTLKALGNGT